MSLFIVTMAAKLLSIRRSKPNQLEGGSLEMEQQAEAQELVMTPNEAKDKVFGCWNQLNALSRRHFPKNENLAHEGLLYVLDRLQANDWRRVRRWQGLGLGEFMPYLITLASRLLTDFTRSQFGYIRKPKWLSEKPDPIWSTAYRLLLIDKTPRHEVIEILQISEPYREIVFLEHVVATIKAKCSTEPIFSENKVSIEQCMEPVAVGTEPLDALSIQEKEILDAMEIYLKEHNDPPIDQRVGDIVEKLTANVRLGDEDCLLLRLRYIEGLKMNDIVSLLNLKGNPYKRYHKIIKQLRKDCYRAGLFTA